jgi:hypothetical protein
MNKQTQAQEEELTFCCKGFDGTRGCRKMTKSIKSEDGTHYNCAECGIIK